MAHQLTISIGQYSDKGRKDTNQDFHGAYLPREPHLSTKGIAIALADGISSSDVSHIASQSAVKSFLDDYYCTSDAWSVKTSVERVLAATNSWLYSQTQQSQGRYDKDRGYVCTLSAMVIKSTTAHLFHVGDARIYRVHPQSLEQLTSDHRVWVSPERSYLSRALGIDSRLDIDYRNFAIERGDIFLLATDGVYEFIEADGIDGIIRACADDLDLAAKRIVEQALAHGSGDNLTVQIVRIDALPRPQVNEICRQMSELPFPPVLQARMEFDGYRIVREVRSSSRSHIYLATDGDTRESVILKVPAIDAQNDPAHIERFLMEEWVARRIDSAHVLKPCASVRARNFIYLATEFVDGQTLGQWMIDHPRPSLEAVRGMVDQVAKGLRAFHRLEMLHQDIRPDNVMIDGTGTMKIIDFGSVHVAGIAEAARSAAPNYPLGAAHYAAPEYFLGEEGSVHSDIYSLGVLTYQMLTGRLPYGSEVPKIRSAAAQKKLAYHPARLYERSIPAWVDEAIRKAVHPLPHKRYEDVAEFVFDLHHPNKAFLAKARPPLIERDPVVFWKSVSAMLLMVILLLGMQLAAR
ncbi:serine/threonine protein phosphatase PrpC [Paucimonas lemoignei]|uniref:Serine/threonine protein phosphatase PrpC n=1 Tax=Paucimonas lemoignei TaxID=29443 RepID=A0A4R3HQT5_PAULE|nr:bifunctional protein-serine/threonine kinase/phosphatase [Paucimonas lemoignei]TCS35125.1 serine/threonine protein phosphatase PrpC [Paucimonas lemoignei]